jgi:hypothetical protein
MTAWAAAAAAQADRRRRGDCPWISPCVWRKLRGTAPKVAAASGATSLASARRAASRSMIWADPSGGTLPCRRRRPVSPNRHCASQRSLQGQRFSCVVRCRHVSDDGRSCRPRAIRHSDYRRNRFATATMRASLGEFRARESVYCEISGKDIYLPNWFPGSGIDKMAHCEHLFVEKYRRHPWKYDRPPAFRLHLAGCSGCAVHG